MKRLRILLLSVLVLSSASASAERIRTVEEGTARGALLDAVRMIAATEYERFIANYCHPELLCVSRDAVLRLQREILPKARPLLAACIEEPGRQLEIVGMTGDPEDPDARLVFGLDCGERTHTVQIHRYKSKWWVASF